MWLTSVASYIIVLLMNSFIVHKATLHTYSVCSVCTWLLIPMTTDNEL